MKKFSSKNRWMNQETNSSWESSFYFIGFVGFLCGGALIYFGYDSPEDHPSITEEELDLLRENVIQGSSVQKCKSILKSLALNENRFFELKFR